MPESSNFITEDTTVNGDITTASSLTIAGTVNGDIEAEQDVTILSTATVTGNVSGPGIQVQGKVKGKVAASGRLVIGATGGVWGDISVRALLIEEGGVLEGQCSMRSAEAEAPAPSPEVPRPNLRPPLKPPGGGDARPSA
ncbi:MAG: polymer-forming cytoskeletal protein [Myxococcota bacterium]